MPPKTLLIVDADGAARTRAASELQRHYRVIQAASGEAALALLSREEADLLLIDASLPGINGMEVLRIARENYALAEIVMMSASGEVQAAVEAIKEGAYHFLPKACAAEERLAVLRNASDHQDLNRQVLALSAQVADTDREFVVGPSRAMREVMDLVQRIAKLSATVLVLGESGTGKELVARLVHRSGERPDGPFIPVNLAAIPRDLVESTLFGHEKGAFTGAVRQQLGKFELVAGGTLFLDEIGDLRLDLQGKLLRAVQEGEIERVGGERPIRTDFRLIAATNVDLEKAVKEGRFREDLYYRLNVIPLRMPPLRERIEDLPELANCFVKRYSTRFRRGVRGVAPAAMKLLQAHWWPGNIRELENLVERVVAITDKEWVTEEDLPFEYQMPVPAPEKDDEGEGKLLQRACETFERNFILKALERSGWNVTATARYLGIPLSTMKHKMDRLAIRPLAKRLRGN
ncbi:MAG: sigma-54-dependent Fis family transcriptional regulator [Acidobacteria bacterium]|nr:MAG: sigma-54-dependent Fis family transcriptional regulator [Acidobacteriota bacterium]